MRLEVKGLRELKKYIGTNARVVSGESYTRLDKFKKYGTLMANMLPEMKAKGVNSFSIEETIEWRKEEIELAGGNSWLWLFTLEVDNNEKH